MKKLIIFLITSITASAGTIYHKDGKSVDGKILEANGTHVIFQREEDLQQFRFRINELSLESQQAVELYHSTERYSTIPKVQTPLDNKTLKLYTEYIDELINKSLKGQKKLQII